MRFIFSAVWPTIRTYPVKKWRRSPKSHVSKRSPVWGFLKTPVHRSRVDGRKRRFSNTMMSYIKQRMPCKTCYSISFRVDRRKQFEFATLRLCGRAGRDGCQVRCGTVLKDKFAACWKCVPQNSPTMHFANQLDPVSRATSKCRIRPSKGDSWSIQYNTIQANLPWLTFLQFTQSFSKMRQKLMNVCVVGNWVFFHHLGKANKQRNKFVSVSWACVLCKRSCNEITYTLVVLGGGGGGPAGRKNCRHCTLGQ